MAEGFLFEVSGLEELERDLREVIKKAPVQAEETLLSIARDFKKSAKKRAESTLGKHKRKEGKEKYAIKRKWGHKLVDRHVGATAMVWNSAPHFHLIENGHNIVKNGRIKGFVPGRHIMEMTRNDFQEIVPERFRQMIDDILKESGLD